MDIHEAKDYLKYLDENIQDLMDKVMKEDSMDPTKLERGNDMNNGMEIYTMIILRGVLPGKITTIQYMVENVDQWRYPDDTD